MSQIVQNTQFIFIVLNSSYMYILSLPIIQILQTKVEFTNIVLSDFFKSHM